MGIDLWSQCLDLFVIQRLNQFLIGFVVLFKVGDKDVSDFKFRNDDGRAADMVGVRVGQYQIIQFGNLLFFKIILDRCAFGVVAGVDQHGMSAAGDERGVTLPYIHKMDFHRIRRNGFDRSGDGENAPQKNVYGKKQMYGFPSHFFHNKPPFSVLNYKIWDDSSISYF